MDDADRADGRIEDMVNDGVAAASRAANQPKAYYTECSWCGDPTEGGVRYCTKDCATDAHRYQATLRRNGIQHDTYND